MENDWVNHDGSVMPKHARSWDMVHVMFRDGAKSDFPHTAEWWGPSNDGDPGNWSWDNELVDPKYQIVAYRVV